MLVGPRAVREAIKSFILVRGRPPSIEDLEELLPGLKKMREKKEGQES